MDGTRGKSCHGGKVSRRATEERNQMKSNVYHQNTPQPLPSQMEISTLGAKPKPNHLDYFGQSKTHHCLVDLLFLPFCWGCLCCWGWMNQINIHVHPEAALRWQSVRSRQTEICMPSEMSILRVVWLIEKSWPKMTISIGSRHEDRQTAFKELMGLYGSHTLTNEHFQPQFCPMQSCWWCWHERPRNR